MLTLIRRSITIVISSSLLLAVAIAPAYARDTNFKAARGELLTTAVGLERAVVSEEGGLTLFEDDGDVASGYPLFLPNNNVFASSPILVDLDGSGNEIVAIGRDSNGAHTLYAYKSDKTLLASIAIPGSTYYDPVLLGQSIVVANITGDVFQYTYQSNSFSSITLLSLGEAGGIKFVNSQEAIVNLPARNQLHVYTPSGSSWVRSRIISTAGPIIYPVELNSTGTILYGVNRTYQIEAITKANGLPVSGFPITTASSPLATPVITELDVNSTGDEIAASLADGSTLTLTQSGTPTSWTVQAKSIKESSVVSAETGHRGLFSTIGSTAGRLITSINNFISSIFGLIRFPLGNTPPTVSALTSPLIIWDGQPTLDLTAQASDTTSPISAAEYYVLPASGGTPPAQGAGTAMTATDGTFNSTQESIQASVNTSNWTVANSPYTINVRAQDSGGEWSNVESIEIKVEPYTYKNLTVSQQTIVAGSPTPQVATLVINSKNAAIVDDVRIYINHIDNNNGMPPRGYFRYTPTGGFEELSTYGNEMVVLSSTLSSASFNAGTNEMTVIFNWTTLPEYAAVADNDISYWWPSLGNNRGNVDTSFAVTSPISISTFQSLTVSKNPLISDGQDIQEARLVINTDDINRPGKITMIINRPLSGGVNEARGYFEWDNTTGFVSTGGSYWGQQYVRLLQPNSGTPSLGSQVIIGNSGVMTVIFRWNALTNYGTIPDNDITINWRDLPAAMLIDTSFAVNDGATPSPAYNSITLSQTSIEAGSATVQEAVFRIDNPGDTNFVTLNVNHAKSGEDPAKMRGLFIWNGTSFAEGISYFGSNYVELQTSGANASTAVVNGTQLVLTYRWTISSNYGAVPTNELTYQFGNSTTKTYSPSTVLASPTFAVTSTTGPPAFNSITLSQPTIVAGSSTIQEAVFTIDNPADTNYASITINRITGTQDPALMRGAFIWNGTTISEGVAYFGSNHVELITSGPDASTAVNNGTQLILTIRWRIGSTYGDVPLNEISYQFGNSTTKSYSAITKLSSPTFAVTLQ